MKTTRAFSLLEVMVGLLVFSAIIVTVLQLQNNSRERMALSANSFAAIQLSSKVMADLIEEARLNPTFLEMLKEFPDMLSKDPVVDGQSFYFRCGRDRQPPWGSFDLSDGGGIDKSDGALYHHMAPFQIQMAASRLPTTTGSDPERHLAEVVIETTWREKDGTPRSYRMPIHLLDPQGPVLPEGLDVDEVEMEKLVRTLLFPDLTGRSFDQAVADSGCDRELAWHVGKIGVCADVVVTALGSTTREIGALEKKRRLLMPRPDAQLVKIQFEIARAEEAGASLVYNVLNDLLPSFQAITDRGDEARLAPIPYAAYAKGLKTWESLEGQIFTWVKRAGASYEWLLQDGFSLAISNRQRDFAKGKVLEVHRLLRALDRTPVSPIKSFLAREKSQVAGKNPYLEKFYTREEQLMNSPNTLRAAFPNLDSIADAIKGKMEPLARAIPELIRRHPQGGGQP